MKLSAKDNLYAGDKGWESDQQLFAKVTVTWKQWLGHAGEHLYAAQLLLPEINRHEDLLKSLQKAKVRSARVPPSVTGPYFFHCAMAVENAFKGVIAFKSSITIEQSVNSTGRLPKMLLGHELTRLAERAGFQQDIDSEYALTFLTRYSIWGGKYPLPLESNSYGLTAKLSDGQHYLVGGYRADKVPLFLEFAGDIYQWARAAIGAPMIAEQEPAGETT